MVAGDHAAAFTRPAVPPGPLGRHTSPVRAVAISADGRVGASLDEAGVLFRYNLTLGQRAGSEVTPGASVIALSPSMLAWAAGEEVCLLNHMAGRAVWRAGGWGEVRALAFVLGGAALAVGTSSRLLVLRTATGRVAHDIADPVEALAWDGAGAMVVVGRERWLRRDASLAVVDDGGPSPRGVIGAVPKPEPWLWREDGMLVPAAAGGARPAEDPAAEGPFLAVGALPGGWVACDARAVSRRSPTPLAVQRRLWTAVAGDAGVPTCVAGHPSGVHLLWGSEDGRVQLARWPEG